MLRLSIGKIIENINNGLPFEAIASDDSLVIKINRYVPFICTAVHNGHRLRKELKEKMALDHYERWYEEDPYTDDFIASMPVTLIGNDSRFEYDLNRRPEECIYEEAWERKVWKKPLSNKERKIAIDKHHNFYKVTHALIKKVEELFGACVVYDMHSYNHKRWEREVPMFNIGAERVDMERFGEIVEHWREQLGEIELPGVKTESAINDVFYGRGYNLEYITNNFKNTLVLATEIKKIYIDELSGESFPKIIRSLQRKFKTAFLNNARLFSNRFTRLNSTRKETLLDKKMDPNLVKLDKQLYQLLKNFEVLAYVNPVNVDSEKKKFFKSQFSSNPDFKYSHIRFDAYQLKQKLYNLKVSDISDVAIRHMYEAVINSFVDKVDLLSTLGQTKFLYNSLRYFGRPSRQDLLNAEYILHLPDIKNEPKSPPKVDVKTAIETFKEALNEYQIKARIDQSKKVIAQVMVLSSKKTILFNPTATFTKKELQALVEHEIGVHMATTFNSNKQKLKVFNLGLPVNTKTQEGLAILSEYLSGNLTMKRLRKLAIRVVGVDMMCNGASFKECFDQLVNYYGEDEDDAFSITTRIYRGGGFTKDYLYLKGFVEILRFWENNNDLDALLVGKSSLGYNNTISEMIEREMVSKPEIITKSFLQPQLDTINPIYEYIMQGLKKG